MNKQSFALCVLFALITVAASASFFGRWSRDFVAFEPYQLNAEFEAATQDFPEQYFTNFVNHFDPTDIRTYQQRFFINDQFYNKHSLYTPIMIEIGCEGPISAKWVTKNPSGPSVTMVEWAAKTGGLLISLEHRYYGKSLPFNGKFTIENLKYLNMDQALADAAYFIKNFVIPKYNELQQHPVIVFGGSYGGLMVSTLAQRYPALVHASVGASGVYHPRLDLSDFLDVVIDAIKNYGGQQCLDNIAGATQFMHDLLSSNLTSAVDYISKTFPVCTPFSVNDTAIDREAAWAMFTDSFIQIVQYNKETPSYYSVNKMCADFNKQLNNQERYELLAKIHAEEILHGGCYRWTFANQVEDIGNIMVTDESQNMRQWWWQTASSYGWYQPLSYTTQKVFGGGHIQYRMDFFIKLMQEAFDERFDQTFIEMAIKRESAKFNDYIYRGNNAIFTAGKQDPWNSLWKPHTVKERNISSYLITNTSHCSPLYAASDYDPVSLTLSREAMYADLQTILQEFPTLANDNKFPAPNF